MKRSGLKARQLGGQGPYSSLALRAFNAQTAPVKMPSSGADAGPAACLEAPVIADIRWNATFASSNALKEDQSTDEAAESIGNGDKAVDSYWGISPPKATKTDRSAWRWNCFMPWESYTAADASVDMEKHHTPTNFTDKLAYCTVKTLNIPVNLFYQRRHISHAMLLETVAAVPGIVGGMLLHLKSLRRFEHSGGWIKALLEEAENERMHLMTFIELAEPKWYERALVIAVQCAFFNAYFLAYMASPKLAHRIAGYVEEEAVISYTEFLNDLDNGSFENIPAPQMAIDYWRLPPESKLRDVVEVIRADEAHHRDLNHYASDIYCQGHELNEVPLLQLADTTYNLTSGKIM